MRTPKAPKKAIPLNAVMFIMVLMFLLGGALGALASDSFFGATGSGINRDIFQSGLLEAVYNEIDQNYVGSDVSADELEYGAAKGLTDALGDPNSSFFDPEGATVFQDILTGTFEGIGAEIGFDDDNQLVIIAPLPGFPAEKAGLAAGDTILQIDGEETFGLTLDEAVLKIRGEAGTAVVLTIARGEENTLSEISITRSKIKVDSVSSETIERDGTTLGVMSINRFSDDTEDLVEDAIQDFLLADVKGVIIDLRNNPGGLLNSSVEVAGHFVGENVIVIEEGKDSDPFEYVSSTSQSLAGMPVAVLVNEGSASASEILAGAVQDYGVGTVIGATTFGKGSVQDVLEFEDGSILKLTIAQWLTPNGRSIEEQGITPDVAVEITEDDVENERDPQLDKAIESVLTP